MPNPTEKAPLAERVRALALEMSPPERRHRVEIVGQVACDDWADRLASIADEVAALEAKLGQVSAERSHWYRVAQAGPTLTDFEWLMWLAEKFPVFDPTWDQAIQDKWTDIFFALKSRLELAALDRTKAAEGAAGDTSVASQRELAGRAPALGTTDMTGSVAGETTRPPNIGNGESQSAPDAPLTPAQSPGANNAVQCRSCGVVYWTNKRGCPNCGELSWKERADDRV